MGSLDTVHDQLAALEEERAFADLSAYRKVRVTGEDARSWLNDLVTCDVASLTPGRARRSLLLTPTGRIRADFTVALDDDGFLLLEAPDQPDHVGLLLAPYVLSSDVSLHDSTHDLSLFAVPGHAAELVGHPAISPSVLGAGVDLVWPSGKPAWRIEDALIKQDLVEAGPEALEIWRIRRGVAKMGVDFGQEALPAEADLEWTIDTTKGCFLGQESVARVRNLGSPPTRLEHVRADGDLTADAPVYALGQEVGVVTSVAAGSRSGTVAIARIRRAAPATGWTAGEGLSLHRVGSTD